MFWAAAVQSMPWWTNAASFMIGGRAAELVKAAT
jgi:hypothetical protein